MWPMGCRHDVVNDSVQMEILENRGWVRFFRVQSGRRSWGSLSYRLAWNSKAFMDTPFSCLSYHDWCTKLALSLARRQELLWIDLCTMKGTYGYRVGQFVF